MEILKNGKIVEEINGALYEVRVHKESGVCALKRIKNKNVPELKPKKLFGAKTIYEIEKEKKKGNENNGTETN